MYEKLKHRWALEQMEKQARSARFKRQLLVNGPPVFKKYNVQTVYLFGSVAVGSSRHESDIDLYVSGLADDQYWNFRHDLEEAVELPIDLYTEGDNPRFIKKIIARGEKIYGI
jgi:predicted nucleotidyltransferase